MLREEDVTALVIGDARPIESHGRIDELSTILHVTSDYPPVFLSVGDSDPFESQSIAFKEVLEKNNLDFDLT